MYKNVISLGFFCGVAQEIERLGLRSQAMPFDWLISTSFEKVIDLIEKGFDGFIGEPRYFEEGSNRADNEKNEIQFFHDFKRPKTIEEQIVGITEKYNRRIGYFKQAVKEPTLFIRYIADFDEYKWIMENKDRVNYVIKSECSKNEIIFIGHQVALSDFGYEYYQVFPDLGDVVARRFTENNESLRKRLLDEQLFDQKQRGKNLAFYRWKEIKKTLRKFKDKSEQIINKGKEAK